MNLKFKIIEWQKPGGPAEVALAKTITPDDQLYTRAPNTLVLFMCIDAAKRLAGQTVTLKFAVQFIHDIGPCKRLDCVPSEKFKEYFPRDTNSNEFYVPLSAEFTAGDIISVDVTF